MKGDSHIKDNVEKRDYRCHVANIGLHQFHNGLPEKGVYVSLTGTMGKGRKRKVFSEVDLGIKLGLYKLDQICAVDREASVCKLNEAMYGSHHVFQGDIADAVKALHEAKTYMPMVNLDFMTTPESEFERIASIASVLQRQKGKAVLVMNFVTRCAYQDDKPELHDVLARLHESPALRSIFRNHGVWQGWAKALYDPFKTRTSKLPMVSIALVKNEGATATFTNPTILSVTPSTGKAGRKELYSHDFCYDIAVSMKKQSLTQICRDLNVPYGSVYVAMERHGFDTKSKSLSPTLKTTNRPMRGHSAFFDLSRCKRIASALKAGNKMATLCRDANWRRSSVDRAMNRYNLL
jgi:hypothetical protein